VLTPYIDASEAQKEFARWSRRLYNENRVQQIEGAVMSKRSEVPPAVLRRMLRRAAQGEKAVVVTFKGGVASRVYGVEQYLHKRELTKRVVKPWTHRKQTLDPLGAIDGAIHGSLSRSDIYE
jgi:hypothetical protein